MRLILLFFLSIITFAINGQMVINPYIFQSTITVDSSFNFNSKSLTLNGINQYGLIPDADNLSNDTLHLSAWIKPARLDSFVILKKANEYLFWINGSNELEARFIDSVNGGYKGFKTLALTDLENQFFHVSTDYGGLGTFVNIYVNGKKAEKTPMDNGSFTSMVNTSSDLLIGTDNVSFSDGKIDQVLIGHSILSNIENKELTNYRDLTRHSMYSSFTTWIDFEDNQVEDTTVIDLIYDNDLLIVDNAIRSKCIAYPYSYQLDSTVNFNYIPPFVDGNTASSISYGGYSFKFIGGTDRIEVESVDDRLSFGNGIQDTLVSWSFWLNLNGSSTQGLMSKYINTNSREWYIYYATGRINIVLYDESTNGFLKFGMTYNDFENVWKNIVITYDGLGTTNSVEMYLDGVKQTITRTLSGSYTAMEALGIDVYLGRMRNLTLDGLLAEPRIYDVILDSVQVMDIYNGHQPKQDLSNTIAAWSAYNSGTGTDEVIDLSGNGNNGSFVAILQENGDVYDFPIRIFDAENAASILFNGTDEYINVPDNDSLSYTDNNIFLSAKIKMLDASNFSILNKENEYELCTNGSDVLSFYVVDSTNASYTGCVVSTPLTSYQNKWITVTATFDGTTPKIYIDDVRSDDSTYSDGVFTSMVNTSNPLKIGSCDAHYSNGYISFPSVGGSALSLCEVQELYNDGSPIDIREATFFNDSVSFWKLNQSDDVSISDGVIDIARGINGTGINTDSTNIKVEEYPTN